MCLFISPIWWLKCLACLQISKDFCACGVCWHPGCTHVCCLQKSMKFQATSCQMRPLNSLHLHAAWTSLTPLFLLYVGFIGNSNTNREKQNTRYILWTSELGFPSPQRTLTWLSFLWQCNFTCWVISMFSSALEGCAPHLKFDRYLENTKSGREKFAWTGRSSKYKTKWFEPDQWPDYRFCPL